MQRMVNEMEMVRGRRNLYVNVKKSKVMSVQFWGTWGVEGAAEWRANGGARLY